MFMFKCKCESVSVQVYVSKCQCSSASVEVSVCECECRSVSVQEIFRKNPSQCFREKYLSNQKKIFTEAKKHLPNQQKYSLCDEIPWNSQSCGWPVLWSAGPLVLWSSGPLVCWSPGPVAWSPAVRWSTDLICVLFVVFRCHIHCLRESSCVGLKRTGFSTTPAQARAAHLWIWCAAGGGAAPPPQPPPRHEICTSSPTPAPATKSIF